MVTAPRDAAGAEARSFGTNPGGLVPAPHAPPLSIDLALSAVARAHHAPAKKGEPIPEGWALDVHGRPTTDARAALEGSMLPAGGVKGAMLALTVELLVCAFSGAAFGFESDSFFIEEGRPTRIGHALLAIDPRALAGEEAYLARVETLIAAMVEDPEVRLPVRAAPRNAERGPPRRRRRSRGAARADPRAGGLTRWPNPSRHA